MAGNPFLTAMAVVTLHPYALLVMMMMPLPIVVTVVVMDMNRHINDDLGIRRREKRPCTKKGCRQKNQF